MQTHPERFIPQSRNTEFDVTRAKIIIGDFLARFEKPCTAVALREILTVNETVIAYFTYVQAYEQMLENAMIELDENGCVRLTQVGKQLAGELSELASQRLREKALASGENYFCEKKTERDTQVRLIEKNGCFAAQCKCFDNSTTLMSITLWHKDRELADYLRSLMNADPVGLYCDVFDYILGTAKKKIGPPDQTVFERSLTQGVERFMNKHLTTNCKCAVRAVDKGFEMNCECFDDDLLLMELCVFAPDERQAGFICDRLEKDKDIFSVLTGLVLRNLNRGTGE